MRLLATLTLIGFAVASILYRSTAETDHATRASNTNRSGLILQQSEGERRVRRPRPGSAAPLAAPGMIIKVDQRNGGSSNFFAGYEEVPPGSAIPTHSHPEYDEILFVHRGEGVATLGAQEREVTAGTTIYIPPDTRVGVKNTGKKVLSVLFVFPRPEMVSDYYREMTVAEGESPVPFSAEEFAAFRARHRDHVIFDEQ
ncbi:MAG TPA: cupin domain-containing protein [Chthoniobacterales bacterium]|jgi:quercetin dioxygenase-like cupin family protein